MPFPSSLVVVVVMPYAQREKMTQVKPLAWPRTPNQERPPKRNRWETSQQHAHTRLYGAHTVLPLRAHRPCFDLIIFYMIEFRNRN